MNPVTFNCTVLRDGHQSLAATRMKTADMLPIAPILDSMGFSALETWGGATIDAGRWDTKEQERNCKKAEELYKSWPSEAKTLYLDDAEVVVTGYGICGRIARSAVKLLRAE